MNNSNVNKEVYDRYVDATVALFMEYYSADLSDHIHNEMNESDNTDIVFPAELDKRCRALIKKECLRYRQKQYLRGLFKSLQYVAIFAVMLLSLSSLLFVTVEAFRIPIINYYIEQKDGYWEISGNTNTTETAGNNTLDLTDPLASFLPNEYTLLLLEGNSLNELTAIYEDADGKQVFFCSESISSVVGIDSEDAQVSKKCQICGQDAVLMVENDDVNLVWLQKDMGLVFTIHAQGLSDTFVMSIAEEIINSISK